MINLGPPEVDKDELIQKTLTVAGVNYTHRNEDLIAESTVEVQRMQMLIEVSLGAQVLRSFVDSGLRRRRRRGRKPRHSAKILVHLRVLSLYGLPYGSITSPHRLLRRSEFSAANMDMSM